MKLILLFFGESMKRACNAKLIICMKFVELLLSNNQLSTNKEPLYVQLENIQIGNQVLKDCPKLGLVI